MIEQPNWGRDRDDAAGWVGSDERYFRDFRKDGKKKTKIAKVGREGTKSTTLNVIFHNHTTIILIIVNASRARRPNYWTIPWRNECSGRLGTNTLEE